MQDMMQRLLRRPLCLIALSYAVVSFVVQVLTASPLSTSWDRSGGTVQSIEVSDDMELPDYAKVSLTGQLEKKESKNGCQIYYLKKIQIIEIQNSRKNSKQNFNFTNKKQEQTAVCYMDAEFTAALMKQGSSPGGDIPIGRWLYVCGNVMNSETAENEGQFDAKAYDESIRVAVRLWDTKVLEQGKTKALFDDMSVDIKTKAAQKYQVYLGEENAGILCAMLLGDKTSMTAEIKSLYRKSGIAHVLAISGLHISLLGMMLYRFLRRCCVPPVLCSFLGIISVLVYIRFAGASVSSFRAVCMFVLFMLADLLSRTYDLLTALAFSAILVLVQKPSAVFEAGFLLSYFAVLGLALVLPVLTAQTKAVFGKLSDDASEVWWKSLFCKAVRSLLPGFSVQVLIFPITLWFYYEFPLYSFLLNLVVVPCMSLVLVSAIIGSLPGTGAALYLTGFLLEVYEWLCHLSERFPGAVIVTGRPAVWQIAVYYAAIVIWLGVSYQRYGISDSGEEDSGAAPNMIRRRVLSMLFPLFCMLIFLLPVHRENRMDMLSVGQGDCVCLRDAGGKVVLVDGGSLDVSQAGNYRLLPYLKYHGISKVDAVFLSHAHSDHYSAIVELLENGKKEGIHIQTLCLSALAKEPNKPGLTDVSAEEKAYREIVALARRAGCEVIYLNPGDRIICGNMKFDCVYPASGDSIADENDRSMVLLARLTDFSVLFTGDSSASCDEAVIRRLFDMGVQEIDCLKVAHHGAQTSTSRELLEAFDFDLALISCGAGNSYGHPHEALLQRLEDAGCKVFVTARSGQVTVRIGDGKVNVREYR